MVNHDLLLMVKRRGLKLIDEYRDIRIEGRLSVVSNTATGLPGVALICFSIVSVPIQCWAPLVVTESMCRAY